MAARRVGLHPPVGRPIHERRLGSKMPSLRLRWATLLAVRDFRQFDNETQGLIHSFLVRKRFRHFGVKQNQIRARPITLRVLSSDTAPEQSPKVVFWPQVVIHFGLRLLLHRLPFPRASVRALKIRTRSPCSAWDTISSRCGAIAQ